MSGVPRRASALPEVAVRDEHGVCDRSATRGGQRLRERVFQAATLSAALLVLLLLGGVACSLLIGAWPAFAHFKLSFLTREIWNPVTEQFGALAPVYGTLVTSFLALLLAIPFSFGIAIFLTELAPGVAEASGGSGDRAARRGAEHHLRHLGPVRAVAGPAAARAAVADRHARVRCRCIGRLFQGPPFGIGVLTASFVLAIMVMPFISAVMRDVFETVPDVLKESGYGLGATTWEVIWQVVVPYARTGMIGGIMLGLGPGARGNHGGDLRHRQRAPHQPSLLAPGTTISAAIANEFTEAVGDLYTSSLIALGALLFLITFSVIAAARFMLLRLERKALSSV